MAKPDKKSVTRKSKKLARKKTPHGAELSKLAGGLGKYRESGFESGKMGMRIVKTREGRVRFSLTREGADGKPETRAWAELSDDDLPHVMRVLML